MKKGWLALVLSIFFPGLGHLYLGKVKKGVLLIVAEIVSILLIPVVVGIVTLPLVYLYAIINSYTSTSKVNEELTV
ncbi:DUF6677 family protein [Bacillus nitroreducens]